MFQNFSQTADKPHMSVNSQIALDPAGPVLDRGVALARVGGDMVLLREIAELFVQECPQLLKEIRHAIDHGDAHALERAAHGLKGSVANFGAGRAVDAAFELEKLGRAGTLANVPESLRDLEQALATLQVELSRL